MPDTPNLQLPYPGLSAPADVPADIAALADRLDLILAVKATAWVTPTLLNTWANIAGFETAGYLKDPLGFVHLRGAISLQSATPVSGSVVFVLPAGYRPGAKTFNAIASVVAGTPYCQVDTVGNVAISGPVNPQVGLSGITFLAEN